MLFNKEPAAFFSGLGTVFAAVVPVLILFDVVHWSDKQTAGVMFLSGVVITFLTTMFTRAQTVPTLVADKQIEIAKAATIDTPNEQIIQRAKDEIGK